jgi:hypothetical protein
LNASSASADFFSGGVAGKIATAGIRRSIASSTASTSRSIDSRSTPGIEAIGSRVPWPSWTNTGQIKSSARK